MSEDSIVLLIGTLTGFVGGFLPTFISNRRDEKCIRREKIEKLYENITDWYNKAFGQFICFLPVLDGRYDWNTYLNQIISSRSEGLYVKTEVCVDLYFPSISNSFEKIKTQIQKLNSFIDTEIKKQYLAGNQILHYKERVLDDMKQCNESFEEIKKILKNEAEKLR